MLRSIVIIFACLLIAYAAYTVYAIQHPYVAGDARIQWADIPPRAKETIMTHAEGGQINKITEETIGKKKVFRTEVVLPDNEGIIIKVDETGKLVGLRYKNDADADCEKKDTPPYSWPTR